MLQTNADDEAGNIKSVTDKQKRKFSILKYDGLFHFQMMQLWLNTSHIEHFRPHHSTTYVDAAYC